MTTYRHFSPKTVPAWNVEALAQGTADSVNDATDRQAQASILAACEALWRVRTAWGSHEATPGDFAMLDGRWHRIVAIERGWRSRHPKFELQDVACPDMPRHRVAWSEIQRVARIRHTSESKA